LHVPVLLSSVLKALSPGDGEIIIDGAFGAGGYARAILQAANCQLLALDRDPAVIKRAQEMEREFAPRFSFAPGRFSRMVELAARNGIKAADGVVLDIGVSSMQLDEAERGFSFMREGPLDMRMSQEGLSAAEIVNQYEPERLAHIFRTLGEERRAMTIARAIDKARSQRPLETTLQLAETIEKALGRKPGARTHPATRAFQALRIYVNRELEELAAGLCAAERLLKPGGRLIVVSFHSLEDRLVKKFLAHRSQPPARSSRHLPEPPGGESDDFRPSFRLIGKKAVKPAKAEMRDNPRARSARLRAAIRLDAPAFECMESENAALDD
jgi:16S rRNA (cytosine1402-N4)-methyltransferase